jgi:uncharacterized ferritin-like protein (DUF455 family)
MEIRAFAEAVLFSADLDLKLASPESFTDDKPGAEVGVPSAPGRPLWLPMVAVKPVPQAPTPMGLENALSRGQALHSFAHHELQALELMALALLRFPDAPKAFRRGLVKILTDEQRHFRLYQERAEHWGVGLGDVGMGHFFWDTVAPIDTPADFVAALCLTYEQANLDFAKYWADAFCAVDDVRSAAVLQEVYEDEISHVRHGVFWFDRLAGNCDFETYRKRLVFPLSPGRGKGPIFNRDGRERAGLSAEFIDEMEITNVSRGRPPRVFTFEPFVEERAAGRTPKAEALVIQSDLASLPMFLAHRDDVVVSERPGMRCLHRLHDLGISIPQFAPTMDHLGGRLLGAKAPWGTVEDVQRVDKVVAVELRKNFYSSHPSDFWVSDDSHVVRTVEEASAFLGRPWIAKAPLSAAGQRRVLLDQKPAESWLKRQLEAGPVVVEPWYARCIDLSVQLEVADDGARILGVSRFWTASNGAYRGSVIGPWSMGLSGDVLRALHGGGGSSQINRALADMGTIVGAHLHALGHRGAAGIDAMVVHTDAGLRMLPILEINPRVTMGRIAIAVHKQTGARGGWFFFTDTVAKAAGFVDRSSLIEAVQSCPGTVFTTDPHTAKHTLTALSVAKNWKTAHDQWTTLGLPWPE